MAWKVYVGQAGAVVAGHAGATVVTGGGVAWKVYVGQAGAVVVGHTGLCVVTGVAQTVYVGQAYVPCK